MADKVAEQKPVESTVEDVPDKVEKVKDAESVIVAEKDEVEAKNGDAKAENGDSKEVIEAEETPEKNGDAAADDDVDASTDKCCIKRKSTAGAETEEVTPAEGATPEKKAKLDETAEAEVAA